MKQWYEKLTCSVLSFDKMSINQSLSCVYLTSCLSQSLQLILSVPIMAHCCFPSLVLHVSLFNGSNSDTVASFLQFSHSLFAHPSFLISCMLFPYYLFLPSSPSLSTSLLCVLFSCAQLHLSAWIRAVEQQYDKLPSDSLTQSHTCSVPLTTPFLSLPLISWCIVLMHNNQVVRAFLKSLEHMYLQLKS